MAADHEQMGVRMWLSLRVVAVAAVLVIRPGDSSVITETRSSA